MSSVTVIIPTFNSAEFISRTLATVKAQTVSPDELILVDDASTDSTVTNIEETLRRMKIENSRIIRLPNNSGPGRARNVGWDNATSEYVAFLDADDSWHPRKLEIQLTTMESERWASFSGHRYLVSEEGYPSGFQLTPTNLREVNLRMFLARNLFCTPSVMIKRNVGLRFSDDREMSDDYLLWLQLLSNGYRAALIDAQLVCLHKAAYGESGLSSQLRQMARRDLRAFSLLRQDNKISFSAYLATSAFSLLKFVRRVATVRLRSLRQDSLKIGEK